VRTSNSKTNERLYRVRLAKERIDGIGQAKARVHNLTADAVHNNAQANRQAVIASRLEPVRRHLEEWDERVREVKDYRKMDADIRHEISMELATAAQHHR
jgi:hypothetical protein